jgi:hypothetical protein
MGSSYILMNNLDSTTAGYAEVAGPTANEGKGWQPVGTLDGPFYGSFNGQGHEIMSIFINRPEEDCVGLFGATYNETVIKNLGVVNAAVTGRVGVGGLVGFNYYGTVSNSYSTGNVNGEEIVGGLVGRNWQDSTVNNSYSTGNVNGNRYVGGLMGANTGAVSNSYSTGSVTGNEDVGGLVGFNEGTVSSSLWDIETSGQTTSAAGAGKTTAEMKSIATFSGAAWNIIAVADSSTRNPSYIWNIVNGVTYPFLSWQP